MKISYSVRRDQNGDWVVEAQSGGVAWFAARMPHAENEARLLAERLNAGYTLHAADDPLVRDILAAIEKHRP